MLTKFSLRAGAALDWLMLLESCVKFKSVPVQKVAVEGAHNAGRLECEARVSVSF